MDLIDLTTFDAVARTGAMSKAAAELHTVQSNVTNRIRHLEQTLGQPLFVRHSRGVALTKAGERLLPHAQRVIAAWHDARRSMREDGVTRGVLRIGSMETTAAVRLPALLVRYYAAHPEVQLEITTGPTAALLEAVLDRAIDGAFVAGPVRHRELVARIAFKEELVLVRAKSAAKDGLERSAGDARTTALVFRVGCSYRQRLEEVFAERGVALLRRLEFGTLDGILGCVGANVGVSVLPRAVIEQSAHRRRIHVEPLGAKYRSVETLFVTRRADVHDPAMNAFLAAIEQSHRRAGTRSPNP